MALHNSTDIVSSDDDDDSTSSIPPLRTPEETDSAKLTAILHQLQCLTISHTNLLQEHRQLRQDFISLRNSTPPPSSQSSSRPIPLPHRDRDQQQLFLNDQVKILTSSKRNTAFYGVKFAKISSWDNDWVHLFSTDHHPSSDPKQGKRKPYNLLRIEPSTPSGGSSIPNVD